MELATVDISVQASFLADVQISPEPMEEESDVLLPQVQENFRNAEPQDISQCEENKDTNQEADTENVFTDDEDNDNETKEAILKGILKHQHIYGLDKKSVDFDMDIEFIPYDGKDYTIDIQIVKELPKRVVSYRELFKKMAEEKMKKEQEEKPDDDEEDETEDIKSFTHLILKEPPIHHSNNDIDVNSYKELKIATGQNEKNEDSASICLSDAFPEEKENKSSIISDDSNFVENGKFSITPVNELLELPSNINFNLSEVTEKLEIDNLNTLVNGDLENRLHLDRNTFGDQNQTEKSLENSLVYLEREEIDDIEMIGDRHSQNNELLIKSKGVYNDKNSNIVNSIADQFNDDTDNGLFDCSHDYLYSEYNEEDGNCESKGPNLDYGTNETELDVITINNQNVESESPISRNNLNGNLLEAETSFVVDQMPLQNEFEEQMDTADQETEQDNQTLIQNVLTFKDPKHLNIDITYAHNGPIQDKHHHVKLESIKEERSFNLSRENTDSKNENEQFDVVQVPNIKNEIEARRSPESILTNHSSLPHETSQPEITISGEEANEGYMTNGCTNGITTKRDIGIQTNFDSLNASQCQLCKCPLESKPNVQEQNMEQFQNAVMPSLNSNENIAILASVADLDCLEDTSVSYSSAGNFKDFTQSTSLDCSSSLSMESFEMDDNSLRIDSINGCASNDISM